MPAKQICDFLIRCETDPKIKKFRQEVLEELMEEYHLTEKEKEMVRRGDIAGLREAAGDDCPVLALIVS